MIIEIRKGEFINKGAELMLYAVVDYLRTKYPDCKIVMEPNSKNAPYIKRAELGLYQKMSLKNSSYSKRAFQSFLLKIIDKLGKSDFILSNMNREKYGIIPDSDIDVILDIAGFAYSEQMNINNVKNLSNLCRAASVEKRKVILMPQAFGPFNSNEIKRYICSAVLNSSLIFARENDSFEYLKKAGVNLSNVHVAPDFTNLIEGILPDNFDLSNNKFCIIPNNQMINKKSKDEGEKYIALISNCIKYLSNNNQKPFILIHEGDKDFLLAKNMIKLSGVDVPVILESHPLKIKGIIGKSSGVISSRFHGLVSALSQGVPAIGTGWSHKYEALFQEYNFSDGILGIDASDDEISNKIKLLISSPSKDNIIKILKEKSLELKKKSLVMWEKVDDILSEVYKNSK